MYVIIQKMIGRDDTVVAIFASRFDADEWVEEHQAYAKTYKTGIDYAMREVPASKLLGVI